MSGCVLDVAADCRPEGSLSASYRTDLSDANEVEAVPIGEEYPMQEMLGRALSSSIVGGK